MDHYKFMWRSENAIVYMELFVAYMHSKNKKDRAKMVRYLNQLKAGYRPMELLSYF